MELQSLDDITLEDISSGLDCGSLTSVQLVKAYLIRIREVDEEFRSILEVNDDAESIADELDKERQQHGRRGPYHGVPILLKDNIQTLDKMNTSAGSFALLGARPSQEASIVTRIRKSGAILLGKANMSEWANYRSTNSSDGWSARGGQTMGTYYPGSSPEGSSSGSSVAVALGLAFASIGTETDGSIVCPAEWNNLVGIKPSVGLVARDGVVPMSESQDTVGPIARTVKDAAELLSIIAGKSTLDKRTWNIPFEIPDYAESCQLKDLSSLRIGIARNGFRNTHQAVITEFERAITILKIAGASITDNANFSSLAEWDDWDKEDRNIHSEVHFKEAIEAHFKTLVENPNNIHTLEDLIDFTKRHPEEDYSSRNIDWWLGSMRSSKIPTAEIQQKIDKMMRICGNEGILGALETFNLDALVMPSARDPSVTFAARCGLPIITVPLGFYPPDTPITMNKRGDLIVRAPGMPFCISFFGKAFSEETLIRVAYAFEQLTHARNKRQPFRLPKTELRDVV